MPFIIGGLVAAIILMLIYKPLGVFGLILTAFVYYFFRDPIRQIPQAEGLVVAPADGRVLTENSSGFHKSQDWLPAAL